MTRHDCLSHLVQWELMFLFDGKLKRQQAVQSNELKRADFLIVVQDEPNAGCYLFLLVCIDNSFYD